MITLGLLAFLATAAAAQPTEPLAEAAKKQLRDCVLLHRSDVAEESGAHAAAPPGLGRENIAVNEIPTDRGKLYAYRDRGGREIVCGIAIYGVDPQPLVDDIIAIVHMTPHHLDEQPQPPYSLSGVKPGKARYFGDIRAPDQEGVLLFVRPPSNDAPSLQADFHGILEQ